MLLFSTVLDINDTLTKDAFIQLAIEWNQGSPHANNVIPGIEWDGKRNVRFGDENLWLAIEEYRNQNTIAIRYEKKEEDGAVWDTDYVMNFTTKKMAIRLDRSYLEEALAYNPGFSTPHFITLLIERGYIKDDNDLPVLRTPIMIDADNLDTLINVICGETKHRLPVVYISKTYFDEDPVDTRFLASKLKGVAHVLVQKSNYFNYKLKERTNGRNEYYGAIGIYYPSSALGHRKYLYHSGEGADTILFEKIIRSVIQYSNSQMVETLLTWQGVNNALLFDRLTSQREERIAAEEAQRKAEKETAHLLDSLDEEERKIRKKAMDDARFEADKILDSFDTDMQKLQKQVEDLTRANESLQYENQGLRAKLDDMDSVPLLSMGEEYEFYEGEIKDIILSILDKSLGSIPQRTRRYDIVRDVIQSNNFQRISENRINEVKRLLKNYDGLNSPLRQALTDLGFKISDDGKHYKLVYYSDGRYQVIFAKTPSDMQRSGKNNASEIIKTAL